MKLTKNNVNFHKSKIASGFESIFTRLNLILTFVIFVKKKNIMIIKKKTKPCGVSTVAILTIQCGF